jgi:hypothetical protein
VPPPLAFRATRLAFGSGGAAAARLQRQSGHSFTKPVYRVAVRRIRRSIGRSRVSAYAHRISSSGCRAYNSAFPYRPLAFPQTGGRCQPAGHRRGITSGIHTAHARRLRVSVAPKLKQLD